MRLTDEELRDVLSRAEEIQRSTRFGEEWDAELAAVIGAAEEVGLSRRAVELALQERLDVPAAPPDVGSMVWARSADGKFYVADVLAVSAEDVRVRFLRGGEHSVTPDQLRSCAFIPGERVICDWPFWGPWTCRVVSYDSVKQRVKVNDGSGSTRTFPIAEVALAPRATPASRSRKKAYVALVAAGASAGALIGSIVTALLLR